MQYIDVERFSINGFKPQFQSHHLGDIYYHLGIKNELNDRSFDDDYNENKYPEHLLHEILESHRYLADFYKENLEDLKEGIWVFIKGYKNNQALNHLRYKDPKTGEIKQKLVPCWYAQLPSDTVVYDVNLREKILLSDPRVENFGCYIPAKELKNIKNIQKRQKKNRKKVGKKIEIGK